MIEKLFYRHYRTRASAATVLRDGFGVDFEVRDHPRAEVGADGVRIRATLGTEAMVYMETASLYIDIDLDDGLHLYGQPTPAGYVATEVTVTGPDSVVVGAPVYPATTPFRVAGLPEQFHVFHGDLRVSVPVYYVLEHFDHLLSRARMLAQRGPEHEASIVRQLIAHAEATPPPHETEIRLDVAIRFQACSDVVCYAAGDADVSPRRPHRGGAYERPRPPRPRPRALSGRPLTPPAVRTPAPPAPAPARRRCSP